MNKFSFDYGSLNSSLNKKKTYLLSDVKDRIKKVAFDVVKFREEDNIDGLWQIQHSDDGDYIVAMYETEKTASVKTDWYVVSDYARDNLNIFYKDSQVCKVSVASLGIPKEEVGMVCSYLPEKLASQGTLRAALLADVPEQRKKDLLAQHPELKDAV